MSTKPALIAADGNGPATAANGAANPASGRPLPPELAHVTNNIVPLSNILRFHTQEAYKQLSRQIELLAHTRASEPDAVRKRKLLAVLVALRQDFVKLYVLVKWAQRSKDVARLIDLLNWLRSQEFCFDNLALGLNELNHFSGAKLPQADILTALEVLVKGRPQLPSYLHLGRPPVSPQRIGQVLRDLNLALTARLALVDDMPPRFRKNYEVKDGRVVFTLAHEFRVSITVANDLVVDSAADYYRSPFFFIDFAFLFGVNSDHSLTSHDGTRAATLLPHRARARLESVVNHVLLQHSLAGLYDVLHKYATAFKLYLIARQLRVLSINSKWRGNIQYQSGSFLVIVNYWAGHFLLRGWRSFLEIGIDRNYNLHFRWFKNGRYHHDHGIRTAASTDALDALDAQYAQELNIDYVLSLVINRHSELLVRKVYDSYASAVSADTVSFLNPHQLLLKLTPKKSTVFAIDPLTGHFYFMNPSPIESAVQTKINTKPPAAKAKASVTEADLVANVVSHLVELRTDNLSKATHMRLVTMGWVANGIIKLSDYETAKLLSGLVGETSSPLHKFSFFRSRTWPPSWFLISMVSGLSSKAYWWVARLKSVKGEWVIQWVQSLDLSDTEEADHSFFKSLSRSSSNIIIHHLIVEELQRRGIGFLKLHDESVLEKFNLSHPHSHSASRTVLALHNDGNLLPIAASASTLFMACLFSGDGKLKELHTTLFGCFRNKSENYANSLLKLGVTVAVDKDQFQINSTVDLSNKLNTEDKPSNTVSMLGQVLDSLAKMNLLIKILEQVRSTDLKVTSSSFDELSFEIDPYYKPFLFCVHSEDDLSFSLRTGESEKKNVNTLVRLLNQELGQSAGALLGCFKYLKEAVILFETIDSVENQLKPASEFMLQNNFRRLHFEPKFISLNLFQFVFSLNSTHSSSPKKIQRDKIIFNVSFKKDRFAKTRKLLLKFSMKDNFNSQNLKFKKLFETIFTSSNEVQKQAMSLNQTFMKLYYDFVIDSALLKPLMDRITSAFLEFLKTPQPQ
ncbi:MED14-domain-containing protein [Metschnikowia bicuspidata var. bicuspidata NRRL YB-4993]|uniref:Mediator of RNA polymerase II transcription subunit 14 n=1 Tax=Metschnikowia bicuspidata var. bicuspidata NRRL YB-4993 TaxID=869754 RepID=A0A1A0HG36_9ASCO|nr:MED14-domain-containing protein [Metschnikowia bicuspidata var. bicuspidata NRRL YB-4993]OBA22818.1 MED14-domain-containing protein [Metschnikowia bicuspidata var. bicuspidata NRRL YB-4993]